MDNLTTHRNLGLGLSMLSLLVLTSMAYADDDTSDIPTIVVTPSRTPTPLASTPQSVSVVGRADMDQQGMVNLQQALEDLPGVNLVPSPSNSGVSSLFIRGVESSHTLVLLDGMPINDPANPEGSFNFGEDMLGSLDHIEVVRGPGSVMYGSNAIGGVVNLITRIPESGFEQQANIYGGSYGTGGGEGLVSGREGNLGYVLDVEGQHSDGFNTLPHRFAFYRQDPKESDTTTFFGKLTYEIDDSNRLQTEARWRQMDFGLNDVPFTSPDYRGESTALNWQVRGEHDWLDKQSTASLSVGQNDTHRDYTNNPDPLSEAAGSNQYAASYDGTLTMVNAQNDLRLPDIEAAELDHLKLITGVNTSRETAIVNYASNGTYGPYTQNADAAMAQTGLFGEMQGRLLKRIDLTAGVRDDFPAAYAAHMTDRLGGVLQLPEIDGRIKSSFGTSYRTPSLFERYGVDNYGLVGNPNLKPETATSWDAGIEKDFTAFGKPKFASAGTTYFETTTRNLIDFNDYPESYVNLAKAEISGTENWIKTRPLSWLETDLNWTYVRSINASDPTYVSTPTGKPLLRRPQNSINASTGISVTPAWRITPTMRYVSSQYDVQYDDSGNYTGRGRVGSYTLFDLATDYKVAEHISLYSTIHNVFDRSVEFPNGYLQEPLTVMVGLKYQ